jgi:hypothetical protein
MLVNGAGSVSDPDPVSGGVKSAEIEKKNGAKRQIIHQKLLTLCIKAYLRQ